MVKLYYVNCVAEKVCKVQLLFVSVEFAVEQSLAKVTRYCRESWQDELMSFFPNLQYGPLPEKASYTIFRN